MEYKIKVEGMHCERCVERIEKALKDTGIDFSVSLADKMVTVNGCEHCMSTAITELEDLGFEAKV